MSKGLEALKRVHELIVLECGSYYENNYEEIKIIEKELKDYEEKKKLYIKYRSLYAIDRMIKTKKEQALELSISKQVNWKLLIWSKKLEEYNDNVLDISMKLTDEEYDLLKEVLL